MLRRSSTRSLSQSLANEPFLNEIGDLTAVLVHHDDVRIALEARVRQIDDIDAAARRFESRRVIDAALTDLRPAGMVFGVIAVNNQDRRCLYGVDLVSITSERRLHGHRRLDLVGARLE